LHRSRKSAPAPPTGKLIISWKIGGERMLHGNAFLQLFKWMLSTVRPRGRII
jgi:hypothetical protein